MRRKGKTSTSTAALCNVSIGKFSIQPSKLNSANAKMQFIVKTVRNSQKNVQSICAGNQLLLAVCWGLTPDMWEMTLLRSTAVSEVKSTPSMVKVCPAIEISQPRTSLLLKEKTVFETQNCQRALLTLPQDLIPHSKTFLQTATPSQTHQTEMLSLITDTWN